LSTSDSDDASDLRSVTVTAVVSDQGRVLLFHGEINGGPVTFAADHLSAAVILEGLRAGETPVADVPWWAILGCPEWCGYEDLHDEEKRARVAAEADADPIVTCEGYGADPPTLPDSINDR
jgi:hypothetical protein